MRELVTTRQFHLRVHSVRRLVVLHRTREPFETIAALDECFAALERGITHLRRDTHFLLTDVRDGPVRNDPEFERAFGVHRQHFFAGFRRIAVVTATAIGGMQVARHARADNSGALAFGSVEDALKYLGGLGEHDMTAAKVDDHHDDRRNALALTSTSTARRRSSPR